MTHSERSWQITRVGLNDSEPSNRIIEKTLIKEYYNKIYEKYNMINETDIKDYCVDLFQKVC
ncbi:hypothetical protein IMX26_05985 [Clostridium sp. 'deep sea']|uniref:hypothetical protein n=1 Tax=Clostridium sp. 'deep sea' TaxID=2779445 RepID=UPI001896554C|nr:hypothetical protein [Clostridium sp. 'deep sea']QOR36361.1 hypothetical protein IMX26_05985 [Clostridium sp. 'deep sea']